MSRDGTMALFPSLGQTLTPRGESGRHQTLFTSLLSIIRLWSWSFPNTGKIYLQGPTDWIWIILYNFKANAHLSESLWFHYLPGTFSPDRLAFLNANEVLGFPYKIALRPFDRVQFATLLGWHSLTNKIEFQTLLCWTDNLNLWPHPHIIYCLS